MSRQHATLQLAVSSSLQRKDAVQKDEAPELTTDEIVAGLNRELRFTDVRGFGRVYYYHPLSIAEYSEFQSKIDKDGTATAANMVQAIIALARNSKGEPKFTQAHFAALLNAPPDVVTSLATTLVSSHRFTLASAEKK